MDFYALIKLLHLMVYFSIAAVQSKSEKELREYLFENYSSSVRPVKNKNTAVNVTLNMKLIQLLDVREREEKLTTQAYYSMSWKNEFMIWNPEDWNGIEYIPVHSESVWAPDIILKNNADGNAVTIQKGTESIWISHTGRHSWYPKVMIVSSFEANVAYFPFDYQNFTFHFGSWSLGENKLRMFVNMKKEMIARDFINSTEWKLLDTHKESFRTAYDSDAYSEVIFTYRFLRKPSYCVITVILPCILLMLITLFSYLLPPRNGERISVLITSLLAFTVFLVEINGSLPRNSDTIPTIKIFYMVTMGECALCFIMTCITVRMLERNSEKKIRFYIPNWIKSVCAWIKGKQFGSMKFNSVIGSPRDLGRENKVFVLNDHVYHRPTSTKSKSIEGLSKVSEDPKTTINRKTNKKNISKFDCGVKTERASHEDIYCKEGVYEMTWENFVKRFDKTCLYLFFVTFFLTTGGILLPAYYRTY